MAKDPEKVMQFVADQLDREPNVSTTELYERAKALDRGVGNLSLRQFNARFPLQVKRSRAQRTRPKGKGKAVGPRRRRSAAKAESKEAVREVFLKFAEDLTGADERHELVRVLASVDRYVDDAVTAAVQPSRRRRRSGGG